MSIVEDLDNVTAGAAVMVIYCTRQRHLLGNMIEMVGCTQKLKSKKSKKQKAKSNGSTSWSSHPSIHSRNHVIEDRKIRSAHAHTYMSK